MHTPTPVAPNRLAGETSPYLLQHAANPVDWRPWGADALALARAEDKPILLSIGYSACHWCHVMAHESFEDAGVAEVMNRLFVNIKVDREERPDLDQIYQNAHHIITQRSGGWPLTMFLTPDGTPFYGGTYFPKQARYGLPGFADLCAHVAEAYASKRSDIETQNLELRRALEDATIGPVNRADTPDLDSRPLANAAAQLARHFDSRWGGFGAAPKFPHPTDLAFLLGREDSATRTMALTTLTRMAEGGIYDQIGGGFARYSVDERWEIPHFEKMLYDNGPLLALYADAWTLTGNPLFRRVAEATADWVMREMQAPVTQYSGGYYSSLDADSEGEEGKYYVWTHDEVETLLGPEKSALAGRHWGFNDPPNFEGSHWHPRIAAPLDPEDEAKLESARAMLFAAREQRVRPGRDDKVLTSWNALMINGLTHAARIFKRTDWLRSAQAATDFLRHEHWCDGRLLATSKGGRAHLDAYLDDHAFLLAALLELMEAEYRPDDLSFAIDIAEALLARFEDTAAGGFFFTAHDHEKLIQRPKTGHDNATPSGNGVAARALQRLGHLLGEPRYLVAAERTLHCFWPQLTRSPSGFGSLLLALEESLLAVPIVILRGPTGGLAEWGESLAVQSQRMVLALPNSTHDLPPALAKPASDDVNAWVCRGVSCLAPITDLGQLENELGRVLSREGIR